jgi:hypothetical protein
VETVSESAYTWFWIMFLQVAVPVCIFIAVRTLHLIFFGGRRGTDESVRDSELGAGGEGHGEG